MPQGEQAVAAPVREPEQPQPVVFEQAAPKYKNPELLIFMIIELVNATCFSCILYEDPAPVSVLKPYLFDAVRQIMKSQEFK